MQGFAMTVDPTSHWTRTRHTMMPISPWGDRQPLAYEPQRAICLKRAHLAIKSRPGCSRSALSTLFTHRNSVLLRAELWLSFTLSAVSMPSQSLFDCTFQSNPTRVWKSSFTASTILVSRVSHIEETKDCFHSSGMQVRHSNAGCIWFLHDPNNGHQ
jgi:hypothetical protein